MNDDPGITPEIRAATKKIRRDVQGHCFSFGPPRTGMSACADVPVFSEFPVESGLACSHHQYSVYWLFQAGRNLCIETELHGFTSVDDAGFTAQQYAPTLHWSGDLLLITMSPQHVPMVVQPGQYAVSRLADADRLHLYSHVRMAMPLPALHHRMSGQSFTFIRGFCGPAGEFHA
jgi:hypothetical protein